ncbi:MAG: alkaline phosphatase [Desulfosarcina sp.]|nr:alkaline phosphatase [Desulfosarcina sp.]
MLKVVLVAISVTLFIVGSVSAFEGIDLKNYKNVIVLIPDGCDETVQTVARWYKGEDLQVDKMAGGGVKIHMANSVITGSAAAATAFATGHKTTVRFLGVGPRTDDLLTGFEPTAEPYAPVASILEAAKLAGKSTGLVATARITHATPAAFACHIEDRGWDNDIMEHLVYNNLDVVFGGGARHLIPEDASYTTSFGETWGGKRTDGENLMDVLLKRGYKFVDSKDGMQALSEGPAWGLFDDSHMEPDIDRQYFHPTQPSIAEMTAKAIELLAQDKDGFFLMVEGSQVDWAGHNNDPIYMTTDFLAFDEAVKVACDFADEKDKTLVMAFADHNTGGMKIGHYYTAMGYTETTVEDLVEPLMGMQITSVGLVAMLEDDTDEDLMAKVLTYWNLNIIQDDVDEIRALEPSVGLAYALARVLSKNYTAIGWTTHGHNGETVPFWTHGTKNVKVGIIDNTDLAKMAADAMDVDLDRATRKLYVDLDTVTNDYAIEDDGMGNMTLMLAGAELPISKDYMKIEKKNGGKKIVKLPGLTVYAPATGKVYVAKKALRKLGLR